MSFEVLFESPPGTYLTSRVFGPGQSLRISGNVGVNIPTTMTIDIAGPGVALFATTNTGFFGGAWWVDFTLPNVSAKATVRVRATSAGMIFSNDDQMVIPIAIGAETEPDPVIIPPPERPKSPVEQLLGVNLQPVLMLAAVLAVVMVFRNK